jgi:hypothetical protein
MGRSEEVRRTQTIATTNRPSACVPEAITDTRELSMFYADERDDARREYLWSTPETAQKSGFCCLCDKTIEEGQPVCILRFGPGRWDWQRGHPDCAMSSPKVKSKPSAAPGRPLPRQDSKRTVAVADLGSRRRKTLYIPGTPFHWETFNADEAKGAKEALEQYIAFVDKHGSAA